MKLVISFFLVGILAWGTTGCEYHRRLEEMKRQREAALQERLKAYAREERLREQEKAYDDVRDAIYGQTTRVSSHSLVHENHGMTHTQPQSSSLPANTRFCPGSNDYFCPIDSDCVRKEDGTFKCRYERRYTVNEPYQVKTHSQHSSSSPYPIQVGETGNTLRKYTTRRYYPLQVQPRERYVTPSRRYYPTIRRYPITPSRTIYTNYGNIVRSCPSGFERVNITEYRFRCEDIDECETEENICEHNCVDYDGSFYCTCNKGYVKEEKFKCVDRNECDEVPGICAFECQNTNGSYECPCPSGYDRYDEKDCIDVDECEKNPCSADQICFNKIGSFECEDPPTCPDGYMRREADDVDGNCYLENVTLANATTPNSIMYKKILLEAKKRINYRNNIAAFRFSSRDGFRHYYSVEVLDGEKNFRYNRHPYDPYDNILNIQIYPKVLLKPDQLYNYTLLITDTPRRSGYSYGYRYRIPQSRRRMELTFYPMKYPRRLIRAQ